MGVAGSGKTTVGERVSCKLGADFLDGDVFQPIENIEKLRNGTALSEGERYRWFHALREAIVEHAKKGRYIVIACSALKTEYRRFLLSDLDQTSIVYLRIDEHTARLRLSSRREHFFPASLCATQFAILEYPDTAFVVDATQSVNLIVDRVVRHYEVKDTE